MDKKLREAERRYKASKLFEDKLTYNVAALRVGQIPPPDIDIELLWDEQSFASLSEDFVRLGLNERQEWFRKWFFPNGLGFAASYDVTNPLPGMAPDIRQIPIADHRLDTLAFRWWDSRGVPYPFFAASHFYGQELHRHRARINTYPVMGSPMTDYLSFTGFKPLLNDVQTLYELLYEVANTPFEDHHNLFREDDE